MHATTSCAELFHSTYGDLMRLARNRLRRARPTRSPETAELIHDAFLRVHERSLPGSRDSATVRRRFFVVVARVMQDLLVEHTRRLAAQKRGAGRELSAADGTPGSLAELHMPLEQFGALDLLALDDALRALADTDDRLHEVVMLRFFMQLSATETAHVMGVCERTVERDWLDARTWLRRHLRADC